MLVTWHLTAETQDLTGQQPPHQTDRVSRLRVAWNGNVDVLQRAVGVAESNDRDVDIRSFGDGLVVRQWVSDDQQARFAESRLGLIGEGAGSETTSDWRSSGVAGELQDSALAEWAR